MRKRRDISYALWKLGKCFKAGHWIYYSPLKKQFPGIKEPAVTLSLFFLKINQSSKNWLNSLTRPEGFRNSKALSSDVSQLPVPCNPGASQTAFASSTWIIDWEYSSLSFLPLSPQLPFTQIPSQICSEINPVLPGSAVCASPVLIWLWCLNMLVLPHTELSAIPRHTWTPTLED